MVNGHPGFGASQPSHKNKIYHQKRKSHFNQHYQKKSYKKYKSYNRYKRQNNKDEKKEVKCFMCGQIGHIAPNCKKQKLNIFLIIIIIQKYLKIIIPFLQSIPKIINQNQQKT